jgi:hypothetical protein
MSAFLAH